MYELDLPEMLQERTKIIAGLPDSYDMKRFEVPCDFTQDNLANIILKTESFDPKKNTIFIYEGCSMYFDEPTNRRILTELKSLMQNERSTLWVDLVSQHVVDGITGEPGVVNFLNAMNDLGEKFVFGHNDPNSFLKSVGFDSTQTISTADTFNLEQTEISDSVYQHYRYSIAAISNSNLQYKTTESQKGTISEVKISSPRIIKSKRNESTRNG